MGELKNQLQEIPPEVSPKPIFSLGWPTSYRIFKRARLQGSGPGPDLCGAHDGVLWELPVASRSRSGQSRQSKKQPSFG